MHAFEAILYQGRAVARALDEKNIPPTHHLRFEKHFPEARRLQPSTLGVEYSGWRLSGQIDTPVLDPRINDSYNYGVSGLLLRSTGDVLHFSTRLSAGDDPESAITEIPDMFAFSQVNDPRSSVDRLSVVAARAGPWGFSADGQYWEACAGLQGLIKLHDLQIQP